jgi:ferredoxin-NADP reductase
VTAFQLLAYISVAMLLQLVAGVALSVWRRPDAAGAPPAVAAEDVVTAVKGAWPGWRDFRVVRREFEDAAQSQCSFHLQAVDGVPLTPFQPGQYLTFTLKTSKGLTGAPGSASTITRCYSLSDRPDPAAYRITVKRAQAPTDRPDLPAGLASSYFHDRVHAGDVLQVKAPSGHFFMDSDASVPAVLIAGGIGITPMMSMLRWCIEAQPGRLVHLYYGVRCSEDHAFKRVLEDLAAAHPAIKLNVVYGSPGANDVLGHDYQHPGYIDVALLRRTLPHGRHQFYVCGPPPMMQSLVPALREWDVQAADIHFEAFGPASVRPTGPVSNEPAVANAASIDVRLSRSGRTLAWDGQDANLLDFVERHGLAVDSGCRTGSCGTCQTRLRFGAVIYADKPDYDVPAGQCLLCVGRPQSALVLDV